jgi:hypothetical protein
MSAPRRSARLASIQQKTSAAPVTPVACVARVAPRAPKKVRVPKEPSAAWIQFLLNENEANRLIDARIKTTMEDIAFLEGIGHEDDFHRMITHLFETLFASSSFYSLADHHAYTDAMFRLVQRLHTGDIELDSITNKEFIRGFNCICLFLSELGFPTSDMFRN